MSNKTISTFQAPVFSALALAFASFGDAFLYPFLPLHGERLGMSVAWIGILLSINRFARIFTNALIARACATFGFRSITIIAVAVAIISTAGYGFATGIFTWILFRISWGLSYSVLRISAISYSLDHERQGFSLGVSKSVQEAGPMITLIVAPPLLFQLDTQIIFFILALASLPGLYFAFRLPQKFSETTPFTFKRFAKIPSTFNLLTFCSAVLVEGIVVVTLGVLFLKYNDNISILSASILAASYLGYRRICLITFSPFGGWVADRYGLEKVFVISVVMVLAGMIFLTAGFIEIGAVVVFAFYSILSALTPGAASAKGKHSLDAVSENATWRDIGAALGTLTGGLLLESDFITTVLLSGTLLMVILFLHYANVVNNTFKHLMIWK
jgi:MFS transporter, DHA1 family, multidrug resistance protein